MNVTENAEVVKPPPDDASSGLRQRAGFVLAPLVFLVLWFLPVDGLTPSAHRLLAILGLTIVFWLTEAIPLPMTALLGPTLCVICGVGSAAAIFRGFADPIIFLFIGSFLLAEAMLCHGLNHRLAFQILATPVVGASPGRLMLAFAAITGFISMWISNTATTAMMLPIGLSILTEIARQQSRLSGREVSFTGLKYGTGLMLMASFASSVGGLGTPVGTPPNLIGIGMIKSHLNIEISFFQWMAFGAPLAVVVIGVLVVYFNRVFSTQKDLLDGTVEWIQAEKARLGPITRPEKNVLCAFGFTIALWVLPGALALMLGREAPVCQWLNRHVPESAAALLGAALLFMLPVGGRRGGFTLAWSDAQRIDWGTILLFGGGLALGEQMFSTGLAPWLGEGLAQLTQARTTFGLVVLFAGVAILISEATSNTASATMTVPVAIAVAQATGADPLLPALAACLGASFGFMLPVSTAPNAMVYGSGCVPLMKMVRYGILLDFIGWLATIIVVTWWAPLVLGR